MFKIYRVENYFFICVIAFSLECYASTETENELIVVETENPSLNWYTFPTSPPEDISNRSSHLYVATIFIAAIVVGMAFLILLRSCLQSCQETHSIPLRSPGVVPVITGFRRSLVPTDTIWINARFGASDKPPDYVTTVQAPTYVRSMNDLMVKSETPPPSYGSIF